MPPRAPSTSICIFPDKSATIRRIDFFEVLKSKGPLHPRKLDSQQILLDYAVHIIGGENLLTQDKNLVLKIIDNFTKKLHEKWNKSKRYLPKFKRINEKWLLEEIIKSGPRTPLRTINPVNVGRPKLSFAEGSRQTKRRRVEAELASKSEEELCFATEIKLRAAGKRDAAALLQKIRFSPKKATRLKKIEEGRNARLDNVSFSAEEALAFFVSFKFTRHQYIGLRALVNEKGFKKLFPTYDKILEAKKHCYPNNILVTNSSVEVPLQSLLDHTTSRVVKVQKEVFERSFDNVEGPATPLKLITKWGSDGSGNQSNYKQKIEGDDSTILTTSIVPLQLNFKNELGKTTILWQNPRTSSTRFCRPLKLQFIKETDEVIKSEFSYVESQIKQLSPTKVNVGSREYIVYHELLKTMVDGKVCNSLMSTSSQKCYLCKSGPAQFNNLNFIKSLPINKDGLNLGLSTLHAYIRFFECFIHISYRLNLKVWRVPKIHKDAFNHRKQEIIKKFRDEVGLLVDIPKAGFGNTNDGNTARRFFSDPAISSRITGVDENLIYRCGILLKTLNSGYQVDSMQFDHYAYETAQIYVSLYEWYPMPPTVHKILMHSKEVIDNFLLPIGQLGEDAQESRHKEVKYYREHNTRKISRNDCNKDLFNILLVSSDPLVSSLRVVPPKKESVFSTDVINLLAEPEFS